MNKRSSGNELGTAMIIALVLLVAVSSIATVAVLNVTLGQQVVRNDFYREKAYRIAEAGIEKAISEVLKDSNFAGDEEMVFESGAFSTKVRDIEDGETEIISVGRVRKGTSAIFRQEVVVRVKLGKDAVKVVRWNERTLPRERVKRPE